MSPRRVLVLGPGADGMRLAGDGGLAASSLGMTVISGPGACNCRMGARSLPLCGLRVPAPAQAPHLRQTRRHRHHRAAYRAAAPGHRGPGQHHHLRGLLPVGPGHSSGTRNRARRRGRVGTLHPRQRDTDLAPVSPRQGHQEQEKDRSQRNFGGQLDLSCRPRSSRGYLEMASGCQCDFERWVMVGEVAPLGHGLNIAEEGHERCRLISAPSGKTRRAKRTRREMHAHLSRHRQAG